MFILVTNDDGVHSPGITVLAEALRAVAEVTVVAPDRERSAVSHSLTLHTPLRAEEVGPRVFAVDGTPTDCVNLGIHGLLGRRPDLVVSGINRGANLGDDITYSGTVAAAMEATLMGVPALALSLDGTEFTPADFLPATRLVGDFVALVARHGLPTDTFLNINFPAGIPRGVRLTCQGKRRYGDMVVEKLDPRGRKYYWIGGGEVSGVMTEGSDFFAVHHGYVSMTPLHLDLTNYHSFQRLETWDLSFAGGSGQGAV